MADGGIESRGDGQEMGHQGRVEMAAGVLFDHGQGPFQGEGLLVGTAGGEGVEDIHDGEDPGIDRDGLALEPLQVARAVVFLVVILDDFPGRRQPGGLGHDVHAEGDVGAHDGEFLFGQLARLEEDVVADADLAHVVQEGTDDQAADGLGRLAGPFGQGDGVEGDPVIVLAGVRIPFGDGAAEDGGHVQVALQHFPGIAQDVLVEGDDHRVEDEGGEEGGEEGAEQGMAQLGVELLDGRLVHHENPLEIAHGAPLGAGQGNQDLDHGQAVDGEFLVMAAGVPGEGVGVGGQDLLDVLEAGIHRLDDLVFGLVIDLDDHEVALDEFLGLGGQPADLLRRAVANVEFHTGKIAGLGSGQGDHGIVDVLHFDIPGAAAHQQGNEQPGQEQAAEDDAVDGNHGEMIT